jgi:hypothetical protein
LLAVFGVTVACSQSANSSFGPTSLGQPAPPTAGGSSGFGATGSAGSSGSAAGAGAPALPPEKEVEAKYEALVATGNIVWVANPNSGRVALVDASTLEVRTVEAGNGPTYVGSVPGQSVDTTLVLNVASVDATLLKATAQGITSATFKTAEDANTMAFSKDGRFAIAWADARKVANAPKANGFQDLAVLDLTANTSTILAVGYRPVAVGFADGSPRAYAVTQDGVALIDLTGEPFVKKNVPISNDPSEDPGTRDVFVTNDGTRAFIRRDGSEAITVVGLDTDIRTDVKLSGAVTDMDVSDDGARAVAVVRDTAEVAVLPVADPTAVTSTTVAGETIGSVALAPGGSKALLYTNAAAIERFSILDLVGNADQLRTVRLYSPVLAVFSSPDAQFAVVVHDDTAGANGTPGAFSVVPIGQDLPAKIVATQAPTTSVAVENNRAIVAERDDTKSIWGAYLARMPELIVDRYPLSTPPIAVGVITGANRAFVAQHHPEGRLTFIDLDTGVARTLTGFELSSRVVDGSQP